MKNKTQKDKIDEIYTALVGDLQNKGIITQVKENTKYIKWISGFLITAFLGGSGLSTYNSAKVKDTIKKHVGEAVVEVLDEANK